MRTGPNIRQRSDGRYEARYEKGRDKNNRIVYGYCYGKTYEEAESKRDAVMGVVPAVRPLSAVKRMNLLILGAGGQGQVVREVAQSLGVFNKISFLDDNPDNPLSIGTIGAYERMLPEYPIAIPSVGDAKLRMEWMERLIRAGFVIPTLISPSASVSPSARIGYGTLVEPKVIVGANAVIGNGCIVSAGAIIDRDARVESGTQVECGQTVLRKQ